MSKKAVSKRVLVTLPDTVSADLEAWAEYQGRATANLASFLIELGLRQAKAAGEFRTIEEPLDSTDSKK